MLVSLVKSRFSLSDVGLEDFFCASAKVHHPAFLGSPRAKNHSLLCLAAINRDPLPFRRNQENYFRTNPQKKNKMGRRFLPALLLLGTCALVLASPSTTSMPSCGGQPCVGPIIARYSGANCEGSPTSFKQLIHNNSFAASPGTCNIHPHSQTSESFYCSSDGGVDGFVKYAYSVSNCSGIPGARSTKAVGRCFNGVRPDHHSHDDLPPNVSGGSAFSYAIFCSASDVSTTTLEPAQSTGSPIGSGLPLGHRWSPCENNTCLSAHVSYFENAQCSGSPIESFSIYENLVTLGSSPSSCFTVPTARNELHIPAQLNAMLVCTNAEMHLQFHANGCDISNAPVFARHYPIYNACVFSQAQNLYFKYSCN